MCSGRLPRVALPQEAVEEEKEVENGEEELLGRQRCHHCGEYFWDDQSHYSRSAECEVANDEALAAGSSPPPRVRPPPMRQDVADAREAMLQEVLQYDGSAATRQDVAGLMQEDLRGSAESLREGFAADLRDAMRQDAAVFTEQLREMKAGLMPLWSTLHVQQQEREREQEQEQEREQQPQQQQQEQ